MTSKNNKRKRELSNLQQTPDYDPNDYLSALLNSSSKELSLKKRKKESSNLQQTPDYDPNDYLSALLKSPSKKSSPKYFIFDNLNSKEFSSQNKKKSLSKPKHLFFNKTKKGRISSNKLLKNLKPTETSQGHAVLSFEEKKREKSAKKIQLFVLEKYLNFFCKENQCIVFGIQTQILNEFFDYFNLDRYALINEFKRIGTKSANGFITEIPFKRGKYKAYSILKSVGQPISDSLVYEGFVGNFINKMNIFYPCFRQTYGLYDYTDIDLYDELMSQKSPKIGNYLPLNDSLPVSIDMISKFKNQTSMMDDSLFQSNYRLFLDPNFIEDACKSSQNKSLLMQYLKNTKSLGEVIEQNKTNLLFYTVDLPIIFYQIYSVLAHIKFTHYDLHDENVQIVPITPDSDTMYVNMKYHYPNGKVIEFNTSYLVKIIDYGRSYFEDDHMNSNKFLDEIDILAFSDMNVRDCRDTGCFEEIPNTYSTCDDLRLVYNVYYLMEVSSLTFGTIQKNEQKSVEFLSKLFETNAKLFSRKSGNIKDFYHSLEKYLEISYFKTANETFHKGTKKLSATINIWLDRSKPIEYKPNMFLNKKKQEKEKEDNEAELKLLKERLKKSFNFKKII